MKKRLGWLVTIVLTGLLLVSCGSGSKNKFVKFIKDEGKLENINYDFNLKLTDLELVDTTGSKTPNPFLKVTETQMKDFSMKGNFQAESKDKKSQFSVDSKIKVLGTEIPVKLIGDIGGDNKTYMSIDSFFSLLDLFNSMTGEDVMGAKIDKKPFEGKYIDYTSLIPEEMPGDLDSKNDIKPLLESPKELNEGRAMWLSSLDSKKYEQKEDEITLLLKKKDIVEFIKKSESKDNKKEVKELLKIYEDFKNFEIKHHINLKTKQQKVEIVMEPSEKEATEAGFKKMAFSVEYKKVDKKVSIKQPERIDILDMEELFDQILGQTDVNDLLGDPGKSSKEAPKSKVEKKDINLKVFTPNPVGDEEVRYESDGDKIAAYVPDYEHYTEDEVKQMLGEPSVILDDPNVISDMLSEKEFDKIAEEFQADKLTESQAKAFAFAAKDLSIAVGMGTKVKVWVYEDGKPNIYFTDKKAVFITPKTDYMDFKGKIGNKSV